MIGDIVCPGDIVVLRAPKNMDLGTMPNPYPDGTEATIVDFTDVDYGRLEGWKNPGYYINNQWFGLHFSNGRHHSLPVTNFELADQMEYVRRIQEWQRHSLHQWRIERQFLRPLPDTPFWEGDKVRVTPLYSFNDSRPNSVYVIQSIMYDLFEDKLSAPYRYSQSLDSLWEGWARESQLTLVERGNPWRLEHGEPLVFTDAADEIAFWNSVGHDEEVPNPVTGLYSWTLPEVLSAMKKGDVHSYIMGDGGFVNEPGIRAIRFYDEKYGRRVALSTLQSFTA